MGKPNFLPGRYRHFKGGEYQLLFVARHSESGEWYVVYKALYGEGGFFVRPAAMWAEQVVRGDYCGPRFTYMKEAPYEAAD